MGTIHKFGDNIDTDLIIPGRYCHTINEAELMKNCMHDICDKFYEKVAFGDVIVGGWNFGCGSSREVAPISIKACGIKYIIAKSFARLFYRNSINIGLKLIECRKFCDNCENGDTVTIFEEDQKIVKTATGTEYYYTCEKSKVVYDLVQAGGLMNYLKNSKI